MNRTILLTATAIAAAFVQQVEAKPHNKEEKGGGGGGGQPAQVQKMPRMETRQQTMPRVSQSQDVKFKQNAQSVRIPSQMGQQATVTNKKAFKQENRQSPSIAFGGNVTRDADRNVRINTQDNRRFENSTTRERSFNRSDFRDRRPPTEIFRDWDRRQIHTWNNHRYRWYNNDWVIIGGFGGYDTPYYYDSGVTYDAAPLEYAVSDDLASEVQEELARRGYDPGGIDGVIGPQTRNAIAAFQSDRGLPVTGRIDRPLVNALGL